MLKTGRVKYLFFTLLVILLAGFWALHCRSDLVTVDISQIILPHETAQGYEDRGDFIISKALFDHAVACEPIVYNITPEFPTKLSVSIYDASIAMYDKARMATTSHADFLTSFICNFSSSIRTLRI